jgi:outer membrane lipopolysaccharide assembly protein LptE/RlpB
MKNLILFILFIVLSNCGYVPIYKDIQNANINIFIQKSEGEENINNLLISKLKAYTAKEAEKNYVIDMNSVYTKTVISKDSAGNAVDIELNLEVEFTVFFNEKRQKFSLTEKFNIKNTSDVFEMNNYENVIKNNFILSIKNKLIMKLLAIQ